MNTVNKIFCAILILATCQAHGMFKAGKLLSRPTMPAAIPEQATLHLKQETKKKQDLLEKLPHTPTMRLLESICTQTVQHSASVLQDIFRFHVSFTYPFITRLQPVADIYLYMQMKKQEQDAYYFLQEKLKKTLEEEIIFLRSSLGLTIPPLVDRQVDDMVHMVETEIKHPDYESFFHGANGNLVILLELQKKLYERYQGCKVPADFEFLRARKGREHLIGITREKYTTDPNIFDCQEPYRTDLLSVAYIPWFLPQICYLLNRSCFHSEWHTWISEALAAYDLPMPTNIDLPKISHGLLLHIFIKKEVANHLAYNTAIYTPLGRGPGGMPGSSINLPDQTSTERTHGEARIILDPTVFGQPNDDVKIYRYQQLTDQEKKAINTFCDELIEKAQKLKERQELEKPNFEYFKTHIMTSE